MNETFYICIEYLGALSALFLIVFFAYRKYLFYIFKIKLKPGVLLRPKYTIIKDEEITLIEIHKTGVSYFTSKRNGAYNKFSSEYQLFMSFEELYVHYKIIS